jgi:hypothetical protein
MVSASTFLWFTRIEQQPPNPFKDYYEDQMAPVRPGFIRYTIPMQMAGSVSMQTLADLVNSRAFEQDQAQGYYSTKFADRFVAAKDLEQVARDTARYNQVTSTFVGPWWADFGITGAIALSLMWGLVNGLLYRAMVRTGIRMLLLLYAYGSFWLVFAIYLNYWTLHGVWMADVPLLILLGLAAAVRGPLRAARPVFVRGPRRPLA